MKMVKEVEVQAIKGGRMERENLTPRILSNR
jgi:hypothetical protein